MWLSQLTLVNFRNFASLRFEPQPGVLLFCGRNGQGKTNLLESVYVLATTRSPRTSVERELLSWRMPARSPTVSEPRQLAGLPETHARIAALQPRTAPAQPGAAPGARRPPADGRPRAVDGADARMGCACAWPTRDDARPTRRAHHDDLSR